MRTFPAALRSGHHHAGVGVSSATTVTVAPLVRDEWPLPVLALAAAQELFADCLEAHDVNDAIEVFG